MQEEFFFPLFGVGVVFVAWALVIWGNHLRQKNQLQAHQIMHQQRLEAMEKGLPVTSDNLDELFAPRSEPRSPAQVIASYRMAALVVGLLFLFSGIGMILAFASVDDMREIWSIGLIPAMAGVGLLIFYRMIRNLPNGDDET